MATAKNKTKATGEEAVEPTGPEEHSGTPSAIALAEVGPAPDDASDVELVEHAQRYANAKRKARWG